MKEFPCPQCGKKLGYRDQHVGKRVRCPGCSARFQLTIAGAKGRTLKKAVDAPNRAASGQTALAAKPGRRIRPTSQARRPRRTGPSWGVLAGVLAGLLIATGAAIGGVQWWKASNRNRAVVQVKGSPVLAAPAAAHEAPVAGNHAAYSSSPSYGGYGGSYGYGSANANGEVVLLDHVTSNAQVADNALDLAFVNSKGENVDLQSYRGKKNLVLVMTRGFPGYVCPICSAQTSRLMMNYTEFAKRDAEVLVVFPSSKDRLPEFLQACQSQASNTAVPFPILLDEDLRVVEQLGIKADLAKPSTYIVDKKGQVRFAYVGATATDRPSVKAMLEQLDQLGGS